MKNSEITAITNAIPLAPETKLPIAAAWSRRLNLKKLQEARQTIDEAVRDLNKDFIDSGKVIDEGEGQYKIMDQHMPEYTARMKELMDLEQEIEIRKVKIEDLGDISVSEAEMDALMFMLEE